MVGIVELSTYQHKKSSITRASKDLQPSTFYERINANIVSRMV